MKIRCEKCGNEIDFESGLKSLALRQGDLQCSHCKAVYRPVKNLYRDRAKIIVLIVSGTIVIGNVKEFVLCFIFLVFALILDVVGRKRQKYELYTNKKDKGKRI